MIRWFVLGGVACALFVALGIAVTGQPAGVDLSVAGALQGLWRGTFGEATLVVSDLLGIVVPDAFAIALFVSAVLCRYRGLRREFLVVVKVMPVLVVTRLTSAVGKPLFLRVRPRSYPQFSYPSGHVVAIAATGLCAVLLCVWLAPWLTRVAAASFAAATVLVAVTRLILGVHWLTDTVGSVLAVLGTGLVVAAGVRLLPGPMPVTSVAA
ncbi:phosphatase PAP2 family protein [Amycolatopsis pigmentata]|uniref:Phosphatase PAP2 family protein n=1 Tax=Amycolatopsis pigmentata TaxID=450801 RepID=A0ABW5FWK6_9PSEU